MKFPSLAYLLFTFSLTSKIFDMKVQWVLLKNYDIQKRDDIRGTRYVTTFKRRDSPSIQTRTRSQVFYDLSMKHKNITALRIKFSVLILKK